MPISACDDEPHSLGRGGTRRGGLAEIKERI